MSTSNAQPLYPVIVQDRVTRQVMMLAYANQQALDLTRSTKLAHFYSRSRQRLWKKGETSGNTVTVRDILRDCDGDAYLYLADVAHPVCHRGTASCFGNGERWRPDPLVALDDIVRTRLDENPVDFSYTKSLMDKGLDRLVQKVGEEAVEVVIAALKGETPPLVGEISDLLYHLAVLTVRLDVPWRDVSDELIRRHQAAGTGPATGL